MSFPAAVDAATLLHDYARAREHLQRHDPARSPWQLPAMHAGRYEVVQSDRFDHAEPAWAALQALPVICGWAQWQSAQRGSASGLPVAEPQHGLLLQAEAALDGHRSAAVRRLPDGAWRLTVVMLHDGGELLCDTVEHLASAQPLGKLRYRRYWRPDAHRGVVQVAAYFIGFVPEP